MFSELSSASAHLHDHILAYRALLLLSKLLIGLVALLPLAISFAIVGKGHRKAWILALPLAAGAWLAVLAAAAHLAGNALMTALWAWTLPPALWVAAAAFRRWRERQGAVTPSRTI